MLPAVAHKNTAFPPSTWKTARFGKVMVLAWLEMAPRFPQRFMSARRSRASGPHAHSMGADSVQWPRERINFVPGQRHGVAKNWNRSGSLGSAAWFWMIHATAMGDSPENREAE